MKIIRTKRFPWGSYYAINLFGVVLSKRSLTDAEARHEYIHTMQMREMLFVGFYLWYGIEWLIRLIASRSAMRAYRNTSFEREAYHYQNYPTYHCHRPRFAWYLFLSPRV